MKISYIVLLIGLLFCQIKVKSQTGPLTVETISENWYLTNYFDTIISNKELAKYRLQIPTWTALQLRIGNDSLKTTGSIDGGNYKIELNGDTLTTIICEVSGTKWWLIKVNKYLKLIQQPNQETIDLTTYFYRKRNDLDFLTSGNQFFIIKEDSLIEYFNNEIFVGEFLNVNEKSKVSFLPNKNTNGFKNFDKYEIRIYFDTYHPHKNLDVVTFYNTETKESKEYNWKFLKDKLILTEFVPERILVNGKSYEGDYLILGIEQFELIKILKH